MDGKTDATYLYAINATKQQIFLITASFFLSYIFPHRPECIKHTPRRPIPSTLCNHIVLYPFPLSSPSFFSPPGTQPQLYRSHANLPTLPIYLSHSAFPPSLPFTRISKRLNHPSILNSPPSLTSINYEQAGATCIDQTQSSLLERLEPHSFSLSLYKYIILSYITLCFKHDVVDAV